MGGPEFKQRFFEATDETATNSDARIARQHRPSDAALLPEMGDQLRQRGLNFRLHGASCHRAQLVVEALRQKIVQAGKMGVKRRAPNICTLCYVFDANALVTALERQFCKRSRNRGTAASNPPIATACLRRNPARRNVDVRQNHSFV